jgi:hypothetical protein
MSWSKRTRSYSELERGIAEDRVTLTDLLHEDQLPAALGQRLPLVSQFLADHIQEIISLAAAPNPPDPAQQKQCSLLLASSAPFLRDVLSKRPEILRFLISLLSEAANDRTLVLSILSHAIDSTAAEVLHGFPDNFFCMLFSEIENNHFFDFFQKIVGQRFPPAQALFERAVIEGPLFEALATGASCRVHRGLIVLRALVICLPPSSALLARLRTPERLKMVLEIGCSSPTNDIGGEAFHCCVLLIESCRDAAHLIEALTEFSEPVCRYVLRDRRFRADQRWAAALLKMLICEDGVIADDLYRAIVFLIELFFERRLNSFLHQTVVAVLGKVGGPEEFTRVVDGSGLVPKILEAQEKRAEFAASFWGHIHELSSLIEKKAPKEFLDKFSGWEEYVREVVTPWGDIVKAPYGGELPTVDNRGSDDDALFYHCRFIDSADLRRLGIELENGSLSSDSDSDSDGESEDYSDEEEEDWEESTDSE